MMGWVQCRHGVVQVRVEGDEIASVRLLGDDVALPEEWDASRGLLGPKTIHPLLRAVARLGNGESEPVLKRGRAKKASLTAQLDKRALADWPLRMNRVPPFHQKIYHVARTLRRGETATYGELAARAGSKGASRAVGQAMAKNPFVLVVPCHRVLSGDGKLGGFSAPGGAVTKAKLLAGEGVSLQSEWTLSDAVKSLHASDPALAQWMDRVGECRLQHRPLKSVFEALAESIVFQQLSGKAAQTILLRVIALFPPKGFNAAAVLAMPHDRLRGAGLSNAKALALKDLATREVAGDSPSVKQLQRWSDDVVVERLSEVRGIGRWTAEMVLLFRLRRPHVFPVADLGVQKGLQRVWGLRRLPSEAQMQAAATRYSPYGSVASWYLWRVCEWKDPA
jgi:O-6-methylguanine DNA methyltransferase